ncbi:hypothetical protein MRX96_043970 [Rhipicephalus microplus]
MQAPRRGSTWTYSLPVRDTATGEIHNSPTPVTRPTSPITVLVGESKRTTRVRSSTKLSASDRSTLPTSATTRSTTGRDTVTSAFLSSAASEPKTRAHGGVTSGLDTDGTEETTSEDQSTPSVPTVPTPRPPSVRPIRTSGQPITVSRTTPERSRHTTDRPPDESSSTHDLTTHSPEPIYTTPGPHSITGFDPTTSASATTRPGSVTPRYTTSTDIPVTSGPSIGPTGSTTPAGTFNTEFLITRTVRKKILTWL